MDIILTIMVVLGLTLGISSMKYHKPSKNQKVAIKGVYANKKLNVKGEQGSEDAKVIQYKIGYGKKKEEFNGYIIYDKGYEWVFVPILEKDKNIKK